MDEFDEDIDHTHDDKAISAQLSFLYRKCHMFTFQNTFLEVEVGYYYYNSTSLETSLPLTP